MAECADARRRLSEMIDIQMNTHHSKREQQDHAETRRRLLCLRNEEQVFSQILDSKLEFHFYYIIFSGKRN